jgi:hypothetical protein
MKVIDDDGQVIAEGHTLTLNTRDCLVFQTKRELPRELMERLATQLTRLFPDNKAVILGPDDDLSVLRQPERGRRVKVSDITDEEIFAACDAFHQQQAATPEAALHSKYPANVTLAKMEKMVKQGKLDYGMSLRTAWVVRKDNPDAP